LCLAISILLVALAASEGYGQIVFPSVAPRDFEVQTSQAGRAFIGRASVTGSAGDYPCLQLLNPSGSTITVTIRQWSTSQDRTYIYIDAGFIATAFATNETTLGNARSGGAAPVAQLRSRTTLPSPFVTWIAGYAPSIIKLEVPIVLPANTGFAVCDISATGGTTRQWVYWTEE
jgi:hypothetical protein